MRQSVCKQLETLAEGIALGYGCTARVSFRRGYPVTRTSRRGFEVARAAAEGAVASENMLLVGSREGDIRPSMGAEDFGFFLEQREGAYVWIGAGEHCAELHTPDFKFSPAMIPYGAAWFALLAYNDE